MINILRPTKHLVLRTSTVVIAFLSLCHTNAESFGIKFLGNTTASVTGSAGVVPITNWNNIANTTFTSGTIHSSDGSVSATLTLSGPGRANGWNNGSTATGGDGSLMFGYADAGNNASITNTITGLTNASYTVYIYAQGDVARPSNGGEYLSNYRVNGIQYNTPTLGGAFSRYVQGSLTMINTNTYPSPLTYGNYIALSVAPVGGVITISANSDNKSFRSPLNGIELVADQAPVDMAIAAYNAAYLVQSKNLTYYARNLTNTSSDGFWTEALDIQGLEDAYERTQSPQYRELINNSLKTFLIQNPPSWSWDGWNDDIAWVALVMVRGYQMTGNINFLNAAEYGYNYAFARGWDTEFNDGGIWEQQPEYTPTGESITKCPLSNNSMAQVACMLYQSTSNATYLAQAQQIYDWGRTHIFDTNTGLVYASISTNGVVDKSPGLYNQGTFVDMANLLHNITGQAVYYQDALKAVEYSRNNLTVNGIFNNEASWVNTWAAEFARGLGHFVKDNNLWSTYYPWMRANADAAWACRRTDLNLSWNAWTKPTPTNNLIPTWAVNTVVMLQMTPLAQPGFVNCTNKLTGAVIGTAGSFANGGSTIAKVFDGNLSTFFDAPTVSGAWVGLDFGVGTSNVIGQISYWPRTSYSGRMLGGIFQGDNNPVFYNPVTLFTIATAPPEGIVTSQTITNTKAFRYVRYVGPANGSCNIAELQFFTPNPIPVLTNTWNGSNLTLSWPGGGQLLQATSITGPWTTNTTATSPTVVTPTALQMFYRVQVQ